MKSKFLSLFLAVSMCAFGANTMAQTDSTKPSIALNQADPAAPGGAIGTAVCDAVEKIPQDMLPSECKNCSDTSHPEKVAACAKALAKIKSKIPSDNAKEIKKACKKGCTGKNVINGSCSHQEVLQYCGNFCCNFDASTVSNCMSSYGHNCSEFTNN